MRGYGAQVRALLKEHGCRFHRPGKGDHEIWFSSKTNRYITVDRHIDSRHTANGILKDAGISTRV